jgi:5-formyltetrahydrofolate cyclo-ligase
VDQSQLVKKQLRAEFRRYRAERFTPESWLHIAAAQEFQSAQVIASYIAYELEPQTNDLNAALLALGKVLVLPRLLPDKDLEWVAWNGDAATLSKNGKHSEPIGAALEDERLIDVVIVPSLRIDRSGTRMGQGGGSYDRALARLTAWKIGLVGEGELTSELLPCEAHDQKLDAAATPQSLTRFNSRSYYER